MGRVGSKRDGGGPVEQSGEVAADEPAEGVGDFSSASVLSFRQPAQGDIAGQRAGDEAEGSPYPWRKDYWVQKVGGYVDAGPFLRPTARLSRPNRGGGSPSVR